MKNSGKIFFLCIYTLLFSALFYVGKEIFFPSHYYAETFIEPGYDSLSYPSDEYSSFSGMTQEQIDSVVDQLIYDEFRKKYTDSFRERVDIRFIPKGLEEYIASSHLPLVEVFLYDNWIISKIEDLKVILYQNPADTRGRMRGGNIHMYGITRLPDREFLSVLIHEFAHYYDIYTLSGNAFGDVSDEFYDISWKSAKHLRSGQDVSDFVSGYASTNQYEDFAESYTYYVLHNPYFLARAQENPTLMKKYRFFADYVFPSGEFSGENFRGESAQSPDKYLWDTTKLPLNVKKFLHYLGDEI